MVLSLTDKEEILKNPRNSDISEFKASHKVLDIYCHGGDVASELEQVKNYENDSQKDLRRKIARSTKDLVSDLIKPSEKVFSASGSNLEIELKAKANEDKFKQHLSKLPDGGSIRQWMQNYWLDAYICDPNAVLLVESDDNGIAYPTYKSINVIYDYLVTWGKIEYLVLRYKEVKDDKGKITKIVYRIYDDNTDGLYYLDSNQKIKEYTEEENEVINHNLGFVPAVIASDIVDKKTSGKLSFINKIDEILKEYMRDSSVHSIYKFLHGFPRYWQYSTNCTTCFGKGQIKDPQDNTKMVTCPTCSGTGLKKTHDVSDGINLPIPKNSDQPKLAPDLAGFVQPDLKTWEKQVEEMQSMKRDMHFAIWGTHISDEKSNTATGRFIDAQPVNDTLNTITSTGERIEEALITYMAEIMYPEGVTSISSKWGRRYMVETPDVLWEKYITAKEKQAPITTLDYLYKQFLSAEYHNDNKMLDQKLKEFYLEPFPHYSLSDLKDMATKEQIQKKLLFSDWNSETEIDYSQSYDVLKASFDKYFNDNLKLTENEEA
ncbi:hypothetical protein [Joostella sp. CR20]|uniref:hypothetical protein n=1 Tax=Joostella sp. CR20 TaxID=2804312 RepID=UPI00313A75F6